MKGRMLISEVDEPFAEAVEVEYYTADIMNDGGATVDDWDFNNVPVRGEFKSVEKALEAVCDANGFRFSPDNWNTLPDDPFPEEGRKALGFVCDFDVNEDREELPEGARSDYGTCQLCVTLNAVMSDGDAVPLTADNLSDLTDRDWGILRENRRVDEGLEGGMKYFVDRYSAESCQDDPTNGVSDRVDAFWSGKDLPVNGRFSTIDELLKAVCDANYFKYSKERWFYDDYNNEFIGDFTVDKDNIEADEGDFEKWENHEMKLWNCRIRVHVMKSVDAMELSDSDTSGWL